VTVRFGVFQRGAQRTEFLDIVRSRGHDLRLLPDRWPADPASALALVRAVGERDVDVLQTHGYKANVLSLIATSRRRRPWVAFLHGVTTETRRVGLYYRLEALAVRRADRVVVMSETMRRAYARAGVDDARLRVIHNAVLDHVTARRQPGDERDASIGIVARLSPEKGVDIGLRAFALLALERPNLRLHIAGEGPERARLDAIAGELGIASRIVWHGHVTDIGAIYRRVTILMMPSRSEGLPNAALEAMASGIPVVATAVGGLQELIVNGRTGILVAPDDPAALAVAVGRLLDMPEEREGLGDAARDDAHQRFSVTARVYRLRALYEELTVHDLARAVAVRS
jgi:glycosyltransferase involved in cell wall biosynthesis